jgi:hypothetical protein
MNHASSKVAHDTRTGRRSGIFLTQRIMTRGKRRIGGAMNLFPMSLLFY